MIKLIVGLGNPGREHEGDRHNVGADFVEALARKQNVSLKEEKKFFGLTGKARVGSESIHLLIPTTYMNRSGQATSAIQKFYKITPEEMLVAHDELDIPPEQIRLKEGGGHGGHNGLRDIIQKQGNNKNFLRLRIGIGHPGNAKQVSNYVLSSPNQDDRITINRNIDRAIDVLPDAITGELAAAMKTLHTNQQP
jgi:PTH1 family peptidyl-tRNA hydrolase